MIIIDKQRDPAQKGPGVTILDHIRMLDPMNPNKETPPAMESSEVKTLLDSYVPLDDPGEDVNEKCYWDKKVIREKQELEKSAARMSAKNRGEAIQQNEDAISAKAAESAARRSGPPSDGIGYYAIFK